MKSIKVQVIEHKCIGAGQCIMASPEVFDQREDDGVVVLLQESPDASLAPSVRKAEKLCPARAIIVQES